MTPIEMLLKTLSVRHRAIIEQVVLGNCTLEETGKMFNISKGRVWIQRDRALQRLSHPKNADLLNHLRDHINGEGL
jgi:DNA-directed RNA polymerase specialized sigma24 family protein